VPAREVELAELLARAAEVVPGTRLAGVAVSKACRASAYFPSANSTFPWCSTALAFSGSSSRLARTSASAFSGWPRSYQASERLQKSRLYEGRSTPGQFTSETTASATPAMPARPDRRPASSRTPPPASTAIAGHSDIR
jgi:hypothetical protein